MYADDTKIYREIKTIEHQTILQSDLDTLTRWSDVWLLKFHSEKCFHLSIGKNEEHESNYHMIIDNYMSPQFILTLSKWRLLGDIHLSV